jgi:hypothetical protein
MWRLAGEAAQASYRAMRAGSEKGRGATWGEEEARARAAIERPFVGAAVAAVEERLVRAAGPADGGGVGGH